MRSFVPPQRRPPQPEDARAPTLSALRSDWRGMLHQETEAAIVGQPPASVSDAPSMFDAETRAARPATRIPLFSPVLDAGGVAQAVMAVKRTGSHPDGSSAVAQRKGESGAPPNHTGMPDNLKAGIESLSGIDMSEVKVHFNSPKPAQISALAYTQGTDIHLGPGHEKHLPHEAWHVVQQKQGRVKPTMELNGVPVNEDEGLEHEAETMGDRALSQQHAPAGGAETKSPAPAASGSGGNVVQLRTIPGKILSPKGAKVYKSIGIINTDAIGGKRAAPGTRVWIDSEKAVDQYEHVTIDGGQLMDGSPIPVGRGLGFVEGYINRDKLEFAGAKNEEKQLQDVIKPEVLEAVDAWLLGEARNSGKEKLITEGGYASLSPFRKVEVFRRSGVVVNIHDANSFKK